MKTKTEKAGTQDWNSTTPVKSKVWLKVPFRNQVPEKLWRCGNKEHSVGESERERWMGSCGNMENKINFFPTLMPCPPALLLKQNSPSVSCTAWKANSSPNMASLNRTRTFLFHKLLLPPAPMITSSPGICNASLQA